MDNDSGDRRDYDVAGMSLALRAIGAQRGRQRTMHESVIRLLCETYPEIQRGKFPKALRKAVGPDLVEEIRWPLGFIPDGYVIRPAEQQIVLFGIEHTGLLRPDKARSIGQLADCLDFYDWATGLVVYDMEGNVRHLNPMALHLHVLAADVRGTVDSYLGD